DLAAVDTEDDVPRFQPGKIRWRPRRHFLQHNALGAACLLIEADAKEAVLHLLALLEHIEDSPHARAKGDGETAWGLTARDGRRRARQADQLALEVDQGAAAAAQVQPGVGLDQGAVVVQRARALFLTMRGGSTAAHVADDAPTRARFAVAK